MKKLFYLFLGVVLLVGLLVPTVVMADPQPQADTVYLNNSITTPPGAQWHFVLNGIVDSNQGPITLHIDWSEGPDQDVVATTVLNKVAHFYADAVEDRYPLATTYASVPGLSTGLLVISVPTPPIPEASTIILLGLGVAAIGAFAFFKMRNKATAKVS